MPSSSSPARPATGMGRRDAAHLLSRGTFGAVPSEVDRYAELSRRDAVEKLMAEARSAQPPGPPNWVREPWINTERRFADTLPEVGTKNHAETNRRYSEETADLKRWWVSRMLSGEAPLREVMTLFWHGHFATAVGKVLVSQAMYVQNATLRRHALGNFRTLLREVALDPAMMIYLDLEESDKAQPNENFARELFELFSLGHGRYTEKEVKEAARALSGWTLDAPPGTPVRGETRPGTNRRFARDGLAPTLRPERHDDGRKSLFGRTGNLGLDDVVEVAATHPACPGFLAGKLVDFFGCTDPQGRVRERMAARFVETNGEVAPMLQTLFESDEFWSEASRGSLIKSPARLVVGACRQLAMDVVNPQALTTLMAAMGQDLLNPPSVKGWPGGEAWIGTGTLAMRYHLADQLLDGRRPNGMEPIGRGRGRPFPFAVDPVERLAQMRRMMMGPRGAERPADAPLGATFDPARLFPEGAPAEPAALADALLERFLTTPPRPLLRATLVETLTAVDESRRVETGVRLVLVSPEYQIA